MGEDRLKKLARDLREREETSRSIRIASTKQRRLLPPVPDDIPNLEIAASFEPCAHVSGDFYDFFHTPDGGVGIVLGDVSGHGIEAGIVMGMAKQTMSIFGKQIGPPADTLKAANASLSEALDGKTFVSLSYGHINPEQMTFSYARAGQSKPIHYNPKWGGTPPQIISSKGLALGVDKGDSFNRVIQQIRFTLRPGDVFFQYTDGLIEATNPSNEQFGEQRLVDIIKKYGRSSAHELIVIVKESLKEFTRRSEYDDDITIMVMRVRTYSGVTMVIPKKP